MAAAKITSKWQVVLPKPVREHMKLHPGDRVDFVIQPSGEVALRPATVDLRQLKGVLRKYVNTPLTVEAMDQAIRCRAQEMLKCLQQRLSK